MNLPAGANWRLRASGFEKWGRQQINACSDRRLVDVDLYHPIAGLSSVRARKVWCGAVMPLGPLFSGAVARLLAWREATTASQSTCLEPEKPPLQNTPRTKTDSPA